MKAPLLAVVFLFCITGCKKNPQAAPAEEAKCTIKTEATALGGNQRSYEYEFDINGNPDLVKVLYPNGSTAWTYTIGSNTVTYRRIASGRDYRNIIKYNQ